MSEMKEQVKPLAPAAYRLDSQESNARPEDSNPRPEELIGRGHQRCIKWGGCFLAILSIAVVVLLVLMLTILHPKRPILSVRYANIRGLNSVANSGRGHNMTIEADVSVKNPNVASLKFINMTMSVYNDGSVIGETETHSREVRARGTLTESLAIELRAEGMLRGGGLEGESSAGMFSISSRTCVSGKVKISSGIKRVFVIRMNCTMSVSVSSQIIQNQNCWRVM